MPKSLKERNIKRIKLSDLYKERRDKLKEIVYDKTVSLEERMASIAKLSKMPRDSSKTRIRNRCELTNRPRGYYRKFRISRIAIRDLGAMGFISGLTKSSW